MTLCFTHLTLLAQQSEVDSLENILKSTNQDTTRLNLYISLCNACDTKDNLKYAEPAVALADKLLEEVTNEKEKKNILKKKADAFYFMSIFYEEQRDTFKLSEYRKKRLAEHKKILSICQEINDKEGIIESIEQIVDCYDSEGNIPMELESLQKGLLISQKLNYKKGIADCLFGLGDIYYSHDELFQALANYQKVLSIYAALKDTFKVAVIYRNLGSVYIKLHNNKETQESIHKAISLFEKMNNKMQLLFTYNNFGIAYMEVNDLQNASINYEKSLALAEELKATYWISVLLNNLGDIYSQQDNLNKALKYNDRALKLNNEHKDEVRISRSLGCLARTYLKQKKYKEAMSFMSRSLELAKKHDIEKEYPDIEMWTAKIDSAGGNYKDAYAHYQQYIILREKLNSEEVRKAAIKEKFQSDYDEQKVKDKAEQDKKDAVAFKELQRQKLVRNGFVGGFAVVLLFAGVFFMQRNRIVKEKKISDIEKKRSEELLLNILPYEVAQELKQTGQCQAKTYSMVTVMFADFKDFTSVSEKVSAELLVDEINFCFSAFDNILQKHKVEKIKTVGDAYMCASGLPVLNYTHAVDLVTAAIEIRNFILNRKKEKEVKGEIPFEIRIGIHTGPVVAGIVGVKKFAYDIWGDTVNIASRIESSGEAGKVNISGNTYELVKDKFACTHRGKIEAKHKGEIDMYFVETNS